MALIAKSLIFHFLVAFSFLFVSMTAADGAECIYAIHVQTGSVRGAGTHSKISLSVSSPFEGQLNISNLEEWGLMGLGHNYFETGNLDLFGGTGPCLNGPICRLNITSDGSGPYSAWYCEYVQVGVIGLADEWKQHKFDVNEWLAKDEPPYKLSHYQYDCLPRLGNCRASMV